MPKGITFEKRNFNTAKELKIIAERKKTNSKSKIKMHTAEDLKKLNANIEKLIKNLFTKNTMQIVGLEFYNKQITIKYINPKSEKKQIWKIYVPAEKIKEVLNNTDADNKKEIIKKIIKLNNNKISKETNQALDAFGIDLKNKAIKEYMEFVAHFPELAHRKN